MLWPNFMMVLLNFSNSVRRIFINFWEFCSDRHGKWPTWSSLWPTFYGPLILFIYETLFDQFPLHILRPIVQFSMANDLMVHVLKGYCEFFSTFNIWKFQTKPFSRRHTEVYIYEIWTFCWLNEYSLQKSI